MGTITMTNSADKSIARAEETGQAQVQAEQRQLVWRYLFSFGLIAGIVAVATMVAHWMRPLS
jgi:hypothetical protein